MMKRGLFLAAVLTGLWSLLAAQQKPQVQEPEKGLFKITVDTELVLVNVVVRGKNGEFVRDLTKQDFTVLEDGKPQAVTTFDFENAQSMAVAAAAAPSQVSVEAAPPVAAVLTGATAPTSNELRNRRLIVLFFDLTSMEQEEIERAGKAAVDFLDKQMTPADLVSVVALGTSLEVRQDFTSDRALLNQALAEFASGEGFAESADDFAFAADESEYTMFNTDRKLQALEQVARTLARVEQKKSIIYFSGGLEGTGMENRSALRSAVNTATRANVAIYPMDVRGLQALPAGGSAQQASMRGSGAFSGAGMRQQLDSTFATQETLVTLAADTGGRAFLDTNDFSKVFTRVQEDGATYYVLGYRSSNTNRDGSFRKITVKVNRPGAKLEHRKGYYGPKDFNYFTREDRERQLEEELGSEIPATDVAVYLAAKYFRQADGRFYVPVSLLVPGSEIPFTRDADKEKATLDVMGLVRDEFGRPVGNARETVKLVLDESQQVRRKNVQYNTGFLLPPGRFKLKFVIRENQSGRVGSFETDITIPDLRKAPLKMSSVVLSSQRVASAKKNQYNPLARDGAELIPNITHVFAADQQLFLYYEVYEPGTSKQTVTEGAQKKEVKAPRLLTSIQFFRGKVKTYETPLVEARELHDPQRRASVFQFNVPLAQLKPGYYTAQVTIVDDAAGTFAFPRVPLLVRESAPTQQTAGSQTPSD